MPQVNLVAQAVLVYCKPPLRKDRIYKATDQDHQRSDMGISYFVDILSTPDDFIFYPMVGTGDVLKIAKTLDIRAIGIEMESEPKFVN